MSNVKQEVYDLFMSGEHTKAGLGRQFEVSARTIGRWIDEVQAQGDVGEVVQVSSESFAQSGNWGFIVQEEEQPMAYSMPEEHLSVIMTDSYLSIGANGKVDTITTDHPRFSEFYQAISESGMAQHVLYEVRSQMTIKNIIERFEHNSIVVDAETEQVMYHDEPVHGVVVQRILDSVHKDQKQAMEILVKFLDLLMENPSYRAVNELYSFLEAADISIDQDGYVVCFKKVTEDYKDIHSGTFDNSVGSTPSIERNKVDEDMNRTCSYGLHVCSKSYLPHFGSSRWNRIVKVRVNPADFVAIPVDYNFAKARVCQYEVIEDVTESYYGS